MIVSFNYTKINYYYIHMLKNTSIKRKIIVDADTNEGRDIPRYNAWTRGR